MKLQVKTQGDEMAYLSLGDFEVCISNNPYNPAKKINEDTSPTYYGQGVDAVDAYKDAYCNLILENRMTRAQRQHLDVIRINLFREADVVEKEVDQDDILGCPFTCAITARV